MSLDMRVIDEKLANMQDAIGRLYKSIDQMQKLRSCDVDEISKLTKRAGIAEDNIKYLYKSVATIHDAAIASGQLQPVTDEMRVDVDGVLNDIGKVFNIKLSAHSDDVYRTIHAAINESRC